MTAAREFLMNASGCADPVRLGHMQIHQNQIKRFTRLCRLNREPHGLGTVDGPAHTAVAGLEHGFGQQRIDIVVFGKQNLERAVALGRSAGSCRFSQISR